MAIYLGTCLEHLQGNQSIYIGVNEQSQDLGVIESFVLLLFHSFRQLFESQENIQPGT